MSEFVKIGRKNINASQVVQVTRIKEDGKLRTEVELTNGSVVTFNKYAQEAWAAFGELAG